MIELKGSDNSPVPGTACLQVNSSIDRLGEVLSWFDQLCQSSIPTSVWLRCQLALAEGFTNAVRYGNKDRPPGTPVDIEVSLWPEHLEIRVWDRGQPFDLEAKLKEISEKKEKDPYASGGRGLLLMKDISDELSCTRTADDRNCLLIVKRYWSSENRQTLEESKS